MVVVVGVSELSKAVQRWQAEQADRNVIGQIKRPDSAMSLDQRIKTYEQLRDRLQSEQAIDKANQDIAVLYMRQGLDGKDEVLIDPHGLSADHTTTVSFLDVSNDGRLMAYATRLGGEDEIAVAFRDLDTRQDLADRLPKARYFGVSLTADKSGFYYSRHTDQGSRVYYHAMGTDPAQDSLIFGAGYGPEKIRLVLNRADSTLGIRVADVEHSIGRKVDHTIVSDGRSVVYALNRGVPFFMSNREAQVSQDIQRLALAVAGLAPKAADAVVAPAANYAVPPTAPATAYPPATLPPPPEPYWAVRPCTARAAIPCAAHYPRSAG